MSALVDSIILIEVSRGRDAVRKPGVKLAIISDAGLLSTPRVAMSGDAARKVRALRKVCTDLNDPGGPTGET